MSKENYIICDCPECINKIKLGAFGQKIYHHLSLGDSLFNSNNIIKKELDFCSLYCLKQWLNGAKDENK